MQPCVKAARLMMPALKPPSCIVSLLAQCSIRIVNYCGAISIYQINVFGRQAFHWSVQWRREWFGRPKCRHTTHQSARIHRYTYQSACEHADCETEDFTDYFQWLWSGIEWRISRGLRTVGVCEARSSSLARSTLYNSS
jgi:hypothetical protein